MIGGGLYPRAHVNDALALAASHYLVLGNPSLASQLRAHRPGALIGLRPDNGKDPDQWRTLFEDQVSGEDVAHWWAHDVIRPKVALVPRGTYDYTMGWCEPFVREDEHGEDLDEYVRWLADVEWGICRRVQWGEEMPNDWRPLRYAALQVQVGHIMPRHVKILENLFKFAWATAWHLYLKPWNTLLGADGDWHAFRPFRALREAIKAVNPNPRVLVTELGTYYPPIDQQISKTTEAQIQVTLASAIHQEARKAGFLLLGDPLCYGIGLEGDEPRGQRTLWDLTGEIPVLALENLGGPAPILPIPPRPGATPTTPPKETPMPLDDLAQQHPAEYAAWVAAGGIRNNFEAHLLGIGKLAPTTESLDRLHGESLASLQQLFNVAKALPKA
jgi:hypothetical protein